MGSIDGIFQNGSSSFDMIAQQLLGGGGGNLGGMIQNFQKIFWFYRHDMKLVKIKNTFIKDQ